MPIFVKPFIGKEIEEICQLNVLHNLTFSFVIKEVIGIIGKLCIRL